MDYREYISPASNRRSKLPPSLEHFRHVIIFAEWENVPAEFQKEENNTKVLLLKAGGLRKALEVLETFGHRLDVLVIDETFFGEPDDLVHACFHATRLVPDVRVILLVDKQQARAQVISGIGLANTVLPRQVSIARLMYSL